MYISFNFILYPLFFYLRDVRNGNLFLVLQKNITNHLELDNYDKLNCNRFTFFIFNIFQTLYINLVNWQFVKY